MYYKGRPSTRWALATAHQSARIDVMHSGDDLAFPDTNLAWWYQGKDSDVFQFDHDMKVYNADKEEDYPTEEDFFNQQEDDDRITIFLVIGCLFVFLICTAAVMVFILRRSQSQSVRQVSAEENPVYGVYELGEGDERRNSIHEIVDQNVNYE